MAVDQHELSAGAAARSHAHADERRSPRWESTRRAFLAKWPQCAVCGHDAPHVPGALNVHHVVPFEVARRVGRGDLELDERNLITLCEKGENHHLVVGHLGDWRSWNPEVRADVARSECRGKGSGEIEKSAWWGARRAARAKHWDEMTGAEVAAVGA